MVIDDSNTIRRSAEIFLTQAGYQVVLAEDGFDALAKIKLERPSLVVMDVVMPGSSGFQITRALNRDPATQSIPVILCTSKSTETDRIWGLRQGARDYVTKPVDAEELLAKIAVLVH